MIEKKVLVKKSKLKKINGSSQFRTIPHNSAFTIPLVVGCFCYAQFRFQRSKGRVFLLRTIPLVVGCFCYAKNINTLHSKKNYIIYF